ncbi:MAG TPA: translational GTPase TypA [bacterium]|nr:translational GTPase TypA [bacterium]
MSLRSDLRNIAIVAHVDHGKTTLVDALFKQSGVFRANEHMEERVMDSNALEKERGITIFSKNASVLWNGVKINIVDTPGHADFGGEVERILSMVDGILLLVDAAEGPLPQTKFVLRKSLERNLPAIVVINKIDRSDARPQEVLDHVLDLFIALGANEHQIEYPVVYAIAREGKATLDLKTPGTDLKPLFDTIVNHFKPREEDTEGAFQMLVTTTAYSEYLGRMAVGRIHRGTIKLNDPITQMKLDGGKVASNATKLFTYQGIKQAECPEAKAGDIILLAGLEDVQIGETVAATANPEALPPITIDEPTMSMIFSVNNSPFAGKEGKFVTSRNLRDRLYKEAEANPTMKISDTDSPDAFKVSGRGELHLGILIETMRREGFEFQVSRPQVIFREVNGKTEEPYEQLIVDIPNNCVGVTMEKLGSRKGEMKNMTPLSEVTTRIEFMIPSRCLLGYRTEFLTDTKGEGILHHVFAGYGDFKGEIAGRNRGVLVAFEAGITAAYGMFQLSDRGKFFIEPRTEVYEGMIVGEHTRENDIAVNPCKTKHLSNMRSKSSDEALTLEPPTIFSLEQCLEYIQDDELLEVTPQNLRMRKKILNNNERMKVEKMGSKAAQKAMNNA